VPTCASTPSHPACPNGAAASIENIKTSAKHRMSQSLN
jgi:hypothetical protein